MSIRSGRNKADFQLFGGWIKEATENPVEYRETGLVWSDSYFPVGTKVNGF